MGLFFKSAEECFKKGVRSYEKLEYHKALKWFSKAVKKSSDNLKFSHWYAITLIHTGDDGKGFILLVKNTIKSNEDSRKALCELIKHNAKESFNANNYLIAENLISDAINDKNIRIHGDLYFIYAMLKIKHRNFDEAMDYMEKASTLGSTHAQHYLKSKKQNENKLNKGVNWGKWAENAGKAVVTGVIFAFTGQVINS